MVASEAERGAVQLEERVRVAGLRLDRQLPPAERLRQPRSRSRRTETERRLSARPGERDPAAIPAAHRVPGPMPRRILEQILVEVLDLLQTQLLALVQVGAAGQRQHQQQRGAGPAPSEREVGWAP